MDVEMQKITVEVPKDLLNGAMKHLDSKGVTDTVRKALEKCARIEAMQGIKALKGSYTPSVSVEEIRSWEESDPDNPWNKTS